MICRHYVFIRNAGFVHKKLSLLSGQIQATPNNGVTAKRLNHEINRPQRRAVGRSGWNAKSHSTPNSHCYSELPRWW